MRALSPEQGALWWSGRMVGKPHLTLHCLTPTPSRLNRGCAAHAFGVDEILRTFGDRRRWQHSIALDGSITLHLVEKLIPFSSSSGIVAMSGSHCDPMKGELYT
jgi:hypothetical protein